MTSTPALLAETAERADGNSLHLRSVELVRRQSFASAAVTALIAFGCGSLEYFPFPRELLVMLAVYSAFYVAISLYVRRIPVRHFEVFVSLTTVAALAAFGTVIHWSGGIASPLIGFYFIYLISESIYGVRRDYSIYAAICSLSVAIFGEYFGVFGVTNEHARDIYGSFGATFGIVVSYSIFFVLCRRFSGSIYKRLIASVAEETQARRALMTKLAELDSCSQIGVLAHRVAHDLLTPIATALGCVEVYEMGTTDADGRRESVEILKGSLEQMAALVKGINNYGRTQQDAEVTIELSRFFADLAVLMKFHPSAKGGSLAIDSGSLKGLRTVAPLKEMQQVFFNLIKNGFEAMRGTPQPRVSVSGALSDGVVSVKVSNGGPHIPEEMLATLFSRQVTTKADGTGVGLLIVRELLKKNSGSVYAENLPAGGVLFTVTLPAAD